MITPDDNEDDVIKVDMSSQSHQWHCTGTSNNIHQSSSANSEGDENADGIEDDLSDSDNDLSSLNSVSLQKKISSEVKSFVFLYRY